MLKSERAEFIHAKLEALYPNTPIPLDHQTHYQLLIAVLLSAQCTDERVNRVTPKLFAKADNPHDMQHVAVGDIYQIVRPCGLAPKKSRAISELSKILVNEYQGEVPPDIGLLEQLPGVGHKTASVVVAQAFGQAAFPVDTHIFRLAQRWGLTRSKTVAGAERDLKKVFPKVSWNKLHLQIIFYGREFCTARGCDGRACDICRYCYPSRKKPFVAYKA
ncbi:MAG TPA: endonuclease III [Porticoccaceae bacterium]|nr:endonuclease III [Porticoccaceae bacterium]|tara:strand:- start:1183 stop:1836 length:654 start_codon:yes stop_codon:yes gene_type:complete